MIDPEVKTTSLERQTDEELIVGFQKGNTVACDVFVGRSNDAPTSRYRRHLPETAFKSTLARGE